MGRLNYVRLRKIPPKQWYVYPSVTYGGRRLDAEILLSAEFGDARAMNCGRILSFVLMDGDQLLGWWEDKEWKIQVPDMDPEAYLATCYFTNRYNVYRNSDVERKLTTHEHQCH